MNRAQLRAIKTHNKKSIEKNAVSKIMQAKPKKQYGLGFTITNRKCAFMIGSLVVVLWSFD